MTAPPEPVAANTIAGKVGNVYVVAHGTTPPFTLPPASTFDIGAVSLASAWTAGNLGYLSEADTPTFAFAMATKDITAWQLNGNTMRILQTGKVRSVKFTVREINKQTWSLIEPGSTYTNGANGSSTVTIPNATTNPDKAALIEIQDLDYAVKMWVYAPRVAVKAIGDVKFDPSDTANAQLTFDFLSETGASTDPLYYVASNHPGLAGT